MATGKSYTYKVHEADASTLVLDSLTVKDFGYDAGVTTATTSSVVKNDFSESDYDAFIVKFNYIAADAPANSKTLAAMLVDCSLAIRTKYGNTEVVSL